MSRAALVVKQAHSELTYRAWPREPMFQLPELQTRVLGLMHRQFGPIGASLAELRVEPATSAAAYQLSCGLPNLLTSIRFRISGIEVWTGSAEGAANLGIVANGSVEIANAVVADLTWHEQAVTINLHGKSSEGSFLDWMQETIEASGAPHLRPSGVTLESREHDSLSTITIEPSVLVTGGIYLRAERKFSPERDRIEAIKETSAFMTRSAHELGIELTGY